MAQTSKSKSFTNLNLTDVKLVDVQLYNVNIDDAKFENGKLVGAKTIKAKIIKSSSVFGISNSNNEEEVAEMDVDVAIASIRNQEKVARKKSGRKEMQERVDEPTKIKQSKKEEKEETRTENKPEKKESSKRYHNLGKIDEKKVADRVSALNANRKFNKTKDFKSGMIAWARLHHSGKHTNVYWPCIISELIKLKDRRKVALRFYEFQEENKLGPKFKKDLSEVECFYHDTEQHYKFKNIGLAYKRQNFLKSYTFALKDFVNELDKDASGNEENSTLEEEKKDKERHPKFTENKKLRIMLKKH